MALQNIEISLRAHRKDGQNVSAAEFIEPLRGIEAAIEAVSDRGRWQSGLVVLARLGLSEFSTEEEPSEAFYSRLTADLERAASWLQQQSVDVFDAFKKAGLTVDLFLDLWIDADQMDLSIPSLLVRAGGRLDLSIQMITND